MRENPFIYLSLGEAKKRGFYKGRMVKPGTPGYRFIPTTVQTFVRVHGFSFLKKIKGRKKRVRVVVKGYRRKVQFYFRVPRRIVKRKPPPKKKVPEGWINVQTFMRRLRREYDVRDMDLIYHKDMTKDVVSPVDSFVWETPLSFKSYIHPSAPDYVIPNPRWHRGRRVLFRAARVWFLLYEKNSEEFLVGSRAAKFPFAKRTYKEAYGEVEKIRAAVREYYDAEENTDYFELEGFVAFTIYRGWERMPYFKHKGRKRRHVKRRRSRG